MKIFVFASVRKSDYEKPVLISDIIEVVDKTTGKLG